MERYGATGETFDRLRPLRPSKTADFPVYHDLIARLLRPARFEYDATVAHVAAVLAGWSYSAPNVVATMMVRMGLERNRCRYIGLSNSALLISSQAYLIQSECGRVAFLVYRGTNPFQMASWFVDANVSPVIVPVDEPPATSKGRLTDTHVVVAHDKKAMHPLEALYVVGHSLGGAMAAMAAFRLTHDDTPGVVDIAKTVRGVYTFGQPMVGNAKWANLLRQSRYDLMTKGLFRHVYRDDPVPSVPPWQAGPFVHTGIELRSTEKEDGRQAWQNTGAHQPDDRAREQISLESFLYSFLGFAAQQLPVKELVKGIRTWGRLPLAWVEELFGQVLGPRCSIYDHLPANYIVTSTPAGELSEFGDF
jgi:Lipase (class 3)